MLLILMKFTEAKKYERRLGLEKNGEGIKNMNILRKGI